MKTLALILTASLFATGCTNSSVEQGLLLYRKQQHLRRHGFEVHSRKGDTFTVEKADVRMKVRVTDQMHIEFE